MSAAMHASDVLIIGAGPSGLCLADELSRTTALKVITLERSEIGSTWSRSPADLRVLSPWWTNILSFRHLFRHNPFALVTARAYLEHLQEFARERRIAVETGVEITSIRRSGAGWVAVDKSGRHWTARFVVCASGYFSSPAFPEPSFFSDGSLPIIHAGEIDDYGRYGSLFAGKRVLVVGKRVTAGQLMVELVDRGAQVTLAADAPISFHRAGWFARVVDQAYFLYEAARIRLQPTLKSASYPPMEGGRARQLLESGTVPRVDRITMIKDGFAVLADGSRVQPDHVVLATGYRPCLDYLAGTCILCRETGLPEMDGFEVKNAPGIFLVGFDNLRNFRSRYLRGIRADARILARIVGERARHQPQENATAS